MEFKELTTARRSCRNFKEGKTIDEKLLLELVELANQAPSWKNSQTARYHMVNSPDKIELLRKECLPEFNQNSTKNAVSYVITSFVRDRSGYEKDGTLSNELGNGWGIYDLGIHNMNFILAAKDRGMDSLILGIRDEKKLRELFAIPEDQTIVSVIALGYEEETKKKPLRKNISELYKFY